MLTTSESVDKRVHEQNMQTRKTYLTEEVETDAAAGPPNLTSALCDLDL